MHDSAHYCYSTQPPLFFARYISSPIATLENIANFWYSSDDVHLLAVWSIFPQSHCSTTTRTRLACPRRVFWLRRLQPVVRQRRSSCAAPSRLARPCRVFGLPRRCLSFRNFSRLKPVTVCSYRLMAYLPVLRLNIVPIDLPSLQKILSLRWTFRPRQLAQELL